jgi:hypothetical protein
VISFDGSKDTTIEAGKCTKLPTTRIGGRKGRKNRGGKTITSAETIQLSRPSSYHDAAVASFMKIQCVLPARK